MKRKVRNAFLIVTGSISVSLGCLGVFLPLLPTTPFLLLAAYCYVRGSEKLYHRLINHRIFGSYIRNYREHKAITAKSKVSAILLLWITIGVSVFLILENLMTRIVLAVIAFAVTIYLFRMNTLSPRPGKRARVNPGKLKKDE